MVDLSGIDNIKSELMRVASDLNHIRKPGAALALDRIIRRLEAWQHRRDLEGL